MQINELIHAFGFHIGVARLAIATRALD